MKFGAALAVLMTAAPGVCAAQSTGQPAPQALGAPATAPETTAPESRPFITDESIARIAEALRSTPLSTSERQRLAKRLVVDPAPETVAVVADLLRTADTPEQREARRALLQALAESPDADPALRDPVAGIVQADTPIELLRPAAVALATLVPDDAVPVLAGLAGSNAATEARVAATEALGQVRTRQAVEALVGLLESEPPRDVSLAAARALQRLSRQPLAADDLASWRRWGRDFLALDPADAGELLRVAADDFALEQQARAEAAGEALARLAREQYRAADAAGREATLVAYLSDPAADLRVVGAQLALDAVTFGGSPISESAAALIRQGIGDPSPRVRLLAARIVKARNDQAAVDALLRHVASETDLSVKLAQIDALAPMRNSAAVPVLLNLLVDPSPQVRQLAGRVAAGLAQASGDDAIRRLTAARLMELHQEADASTPEGRRQQRDALAAVSQLSTDSLASFYRDLLRGSRPPGRESAEMRALVLNGVATLRDPRLSEAVVPSLSDPEPAVRVAAVTALAATGGFERSARQLERFFDPAAEPEASVRAAAWKAFLSVLPSADDVRLAAVPDRLREPERKLEVLRELARRAEARGDAEALADRQFQMAEILTDRLGRHAEAAPLFEQALEYTLSNHDPEAAPSVTVADRTRSALEAYIQAGRLDDVSRLAEQLLSTRPTLVQDVGYAAKREATRLINAGQTGEASALITAALEWTPPLDETTRRNLRDMLVGLQGT